MVEGAADGGTRITRRHVTVDGDGVTEEATNYPTQDHTKDNEQDNSN